MRKINFLFFLLTVYFLFSCSGKNPGGKQSSDDTLANQLPELIDSAAEHKRLQAELHEYYDKHFADGTFLKYVLGKDRVISIHWGNKNFERSTEDELYPGWAPSEFKCEWKNYIGMPHSCGSPCWSHFLLPKNKKDSIIAYDYPLAFDTLNSLIFYKDMEKKPNEFTVENVDTHRRFFVFLDSLEQCGHWSGHIDSAAFVKNGLFVRWDIFCDYSKDARRKEKVFRLKSKR